MKVPRWPIWALLPLGLFAADAKKPAPPAAIAKMAWLAGNWRMEKAGRVIDEQWMPPAAGVMLGMSRTVAKGRVVAHEFMQIREGPGGQLFFVAQPSGQAEAAFQVLTLTDNAVVFENQQHDFPQRVSYLRQADGSILAAIEGLAPNGEPKRVEFPYRKITP